MFLEVIRNNETTQLLTKYILTEERGTLLEKNSFLIRKRALTLQMFLVFAFFRNHITLSSTNVDTLASSLSSNVFAASRAISRFLSLACSSSILVDIEAMRSSWDFSLA